MYMGMVDYAKGNYILITSNNTNRVIIRNMSLLFDGWDVLMYVWFSCLICIPDALRNGV